MDKVNTHMQIEKEALRMTISALQNLKKELETSCQSLKQFLNVTHDTSVVAAFPSYKNMLEQLDEIPQVKEPEQIEDFNCREFLDQSIAKVCERFKCDIFDKKEKEIDTLRQHLEGKEIDIISLEDKIKGQIIEIQSLQIKTKKIEIENANFRHNLEGKETDILSLEDKLKDRTEEIQSLQEKIMELEAETVNYSQYLKEKETDIKSLEDKIKNQKGEIQSLQNKIKKMETENVKFRQDLKEKVKDIKSLEDKIKDRTEKNRSLQKKVKKIEKEIVDSFRQNLNEKEKDIISLKDKIKYDKEELQSLQVKIKQTETENVNYRQPSIHREGEIRSLDYKIMKTETENMKYSEKVKETEKQLRRLKDEINLVKTENNRLVTIMKGQIRADEKVTNKNDVDTLLVVAFHLDNKNACCCISIKRFDEMYHSMIWPKTWRNDYNTYNALFTPTCILIGKKDKHFISFGYEAKHKYDEMVEDNKAQEYYFFKNFLAELQTRKDISINMRLKDVKDETLPAVDVIAAVIKSLSEPAISLIEKTPYIRKNEIKWVLTVPVLCTIRATELFMESAKMADIDSDNLMIALEPEASSVYCQQLSPEMFLGSSKEFPDNDLNYLVVNIGDERMDITAYHEINENEIQELIFTSNDKCGRVSFEKEFVNVIKDIVGEAVLDLLTRENPLDYSDLMENFNIAVLKKFCFRDSDKVDRMTIPFVTLTEFCQRILGKDLKAAVADSAYRNHIEIINDKMLMNKNLVESFFASTFKCIDFEIKQMLALLEVKINTLLLVGICAGYPSVQDNIQKQFPDMELLIPEDPEFAVVKGAVLIGYNPNYISSRIPRCTCGRRIRPLTDLSK